LGDLSTGRKCCIINSENPGVRVLIEFDRNQMRDGKWVLENGKRKMDLGKTGYFGGVRELGIFLGIDVPHGDTWQATK